MKQLLLRYVYYVEGCFFTDTSEQTDKHYFKLKKPVLNCFTTKLWDKRCTSSRGGGRAGVKESGRELRTEATRIEYKKRVRVERARVRLWRNVTVFSAVQMGRTGYTTSGGEEKWGVNPTERRSAAGADIALSLHASSVCLYLAGIGLSSVIHAALGDRAAIEAVTVTVGGRQTIMEVSHLQPGLEGGCDGLSGCDRGQMMVQTHSELIHSLMSWSEAEWILQGFIRCSPNVAFSY